jgi:hypothetical protein
VIFSLLYFCTPSFIVNFFLITFASGHIPNIEEIT